MITVNYKTFEQKITDKSYFVFLEVSSVDEDVEVNEKITDLIENRVIEEYRDLVTDNGEAVSYVDCEPLWLDHSRGRLLIVGIDKVAVNEKQITISEELIEKFEQEKSKEL